MPVHRHGVSKCILTIKRGHQVHLDDELSIYILDTLYQNTNERVKQYEGYLHM